MPITWEDMDAWRHAYDSMTVAEQRDFYNDVFRDFPEQSHYNAERLAEVIETFAPRTVLELGGWDGEAAVAMLEKFPGITSWTNVEVSDRALAVNPETDRYLHYPLEDEWYWEMDWACDLFVSSHTIEHLKARDLEATIRATDARVLYLDSPLDDTGHTWWATPTTHILEIGWTTIDVIAARYGYTLHERQRHQLDERSGGWSATSVYVK